MSSASDAELVEPLARCKRLLEAGLISASEYELAKQRVLDELVTEPGTGAAAKVHSWYRTPALEGRRATRVSSNANRREIIADKCFVSRHLHMICLRLMDTRACRLLEGKVCLRISERGNFGALVHGNPLARVRPLRGARAGKERGANAIDRDRLHLRATQCERLDRETILVQHGGVRDQHVVRREGDALNTKYFRGSESNCEHYSRKM